jgi:hypothetical protein
MVSFLLSTSAAISSLAQRVAGFPLSIVNVPLFIARRPSPNFYKLYPNAGLFATEKIAKMLASILPRISLINA